MKIAIFHFHPLEFYPPATNLANCISQEKHSNESNIRIFTTRLPDRHTVFVSPSKNIEIIRLGTFSPKSSQFLRYLNYIKYYMFSTLNCLVWRPSKALYIESISGWPALILSFLFNKIPILAHFHEYMTPDEYRKNRLNRIIHYFESKYLLPSAIWISHTNKDRLNFFLQDIGLPFDSGKHFVFPNFPPSSWSNKFPSKPLEYPVKFVYIGSFGSLSQLYIAELWNWIQAQNGKVSLDIYSFNISSEVSKFIDSHPNEYITFEGSIEYSNIPNILNKYHIGLIIYKSTEKNFIYNAPNKLFEYLVCGLDVWYPIEMIGCTEYQSNESSPKVLGIDFNRLNEIELEDLVQRRDTHKKPRAYSCENASRVLIDKLLSQ